jgi:hypothetical protein
MVVLNQPTHWKDLEATRTSVISPDHWNLSWHCSCYGVMLAVSQKNERCRGVPFAHSRSAKKID